MLKVVTARVREGISIPKELQALIHMLNNMIYKEEHILFPMALETLGLLWVIQTILISGY